MATQFYVEQADRSYLSGVADEEVKAGVLVADHAGEGVRRLEFADADYDGLAVYDVEQLAAEDHDVNTTAADFIYDSGDRVRYQPSEDGAVLKVRTIRDGGDSAVSIGHRDVVGVLDESVVDLNGADQDYTGRIVEEGYTETTTFNRSNSNFKAVGRAVRPGKQAGDTVTAFDEPVRVVVFDELKE